GLFMSPSYTTANRSALLGGALGCPGAPPGHFRALLARLAEPDRDGLFAALHRASGPALERALLAAMHRRFHRLRRRASVHCNVCCFNWRSAPPPRPPARTDLS